MIKLIMTLTLVLILGACSSTTPDTTEIIATTNTESNTWWKSAGEADSEYWWVSSYEDQYE